MKLLVTGGAGFIGSNFIHYILEKYKDYKVVNLDLLTYAGNLKNLKDIEKNKNYSFVLGDIADRDLVDRLFEKEKFDSVINFAAESHVDRSVTNPGVFIETNIVGTSVLLEVSKKYKVKRYHQVSTDEVYGDLPLNRTDLLFTEKSALNPSSPYSASKTSADLLVLAYYRTYNMPVTVSRCSNNYGAYQYPEKLIPLTIIRAYHNQTLPIYGNGLNVRDWIHVYDHCTALDKILHDGQVGEVYNIGGHQEKTNLEVVKTILQEMGKSEKLITFVKDRQGHDLRYAIDSSFLEKALGWSPKYKFEEGMKQTIQWYLQNKDWWK